jgi:hypothetical protein
LTLFEGREPAEIKRIKEIEAKFGEKLKMSPEELIELSEKGDVRMILRELLLYVYK